MGEQAPERIILRPEAGNPITDGTWCDDSTHDSDTEYIRADIHAALQREIATLRAEENSDAEGEEG